MASMPVPVTSAGLFQPSVSVSAVEAWERETDKRQWQSVETVSRAAACEINMISKVSMFIYWKYLDRMQSSPAAAASGAERQGRPA